jgi:HAD superfamily hydrolase (TIGR01549 family)
MERPEIRLVLFDLDGTLVTLNFNADKTRSELHEYYFSEHGLDLFFKPLLQRINEAEKLIEERSDMAAARAATTRANEILRENESEALVGARLILKASEAVSAFREKGVRVGVFSRTTTSVVEASIERFGLGPFDIVLSRENTALTKPSPEPVELALSNLKIKPEHCLVVGDHPYDIRSGKGAGALSAGVLTGLAGKKDLLDAGADYVFDDLRGLVLEILGVEL